MQPLNYIRPGVTRPDEARLPAAAGFMVGIAITLVTTVAVWWLLRKTRTAPGVSLWLVPCVALVAAGVLEGRLRWRGVAAGVAFTLGMIVLVGCAGVLIICGGMR